ncbi:hypothetical protein NQT72_05600 [Pseudoalteromonas carrageenovora]|uniref:hypothetical protein n=1 Tax=Pseudoalteromonas carrageenovora TaxID=227 RepID=UPI0021197001|nr:hypothetical protein [Pseudoalteromonas carrageenovora]MCQ8888980.1 hypothetical protein [Pseudoalteromonas carrageenovora]
MDIKIVVKKKLSVYEAKAFDTDGKLIDSLVALSESNARRLLKEKLGLVKKSKPKKSKPKKVPSSLLDSGSVLTGLRGVTSSKPWRKTK